MPASFNKVLLLGNLTRDPELRYLPSGQPVATFTVACNRAYTSQTGEKKEEVSFIRTVVWAKLAERCNEYLKKGSPVFVEGRLQSRSWDAPDGSKRSTIEVVAQSVQFLGRGGARPGDPQSAAVDLPGEEGSAFEEIEQAPASSRGKRPAAPAHDDLAPDDEVPF